MKEAENNVTIKTVAEHAGVSPATVSRLLNHDSSLRILPETRERIMESVRLTGYHPNSAAKNLRSRKTGLVGLTLVDFTNPFYAPIIRGIQEVLTQNEYSCMIGETLDDDKNAFSLIDVFLERQVDGFIITTAKLNDPIADYLEKKNVRYVQLTRYTPSSTAPYIICDHYNSMKNVLEYLIGLGHRRIAFLSSGPEHSTGKLQTDAYRDTLRANGIPIIEGYITEADWTAENVRSHCVDQLLCQEERPTAIVATNDVVAISAMSALQAKGFRVPEDISVVGMNNISLSHLVAPGLTTVDFPAYEMGMRAAKQILKILQNRPLDEPAEMVMPTELVIRGTSAPPPTD